MRLLRSSLLALAGLLALVLAAGTALAGTGDADPGGGLVGRWLPADGAAAGRAFVEFAADGTWTGSDGCNRTRGTWELGPGGGIAATAGPSTLVRIAHEPST